MLYYILFSIDYESFPKSNRKSKFCLFKLRTKNSRSTAIAYYYLAYTKQRNILKIFNTSAPLFKTVPEKRFFTLIEGDFQLLKDIEVTWYFLHNYLNFFRHLGMKLYFAVKESNQIFLYKALKYLIDCI